MHTKSKKTNMRREKSGEAAQKSFVKAQVGDMSAPDGDHRGLTERQSEWYTLLCAKSMGGESHKNAEIS